jgi:superfamily II DNA or RNA helicase
VKSISENTLQLVKSISRSLRTYRVRPDHVHVKQIGSRVFGLRVQPEVEHIPLPRSGVAPIEATLLQILPTVEEIRLRTEIDRTGFDLRQIDTVPLADRRDSRFFCGYTGADGTDPLQPLVEIHKIDEWPKTDGRFHCEPLGCLFNRLRLWIPEDLELHRVDIGALKASVARYGFPDDRKDKGPTGFSHTDRSQQQPLPRVMPLDSSPELKAAGLAERLRWILTPPINQLVADLYVPETPFPFQLQGIAWLMQRKNALLADEMGLGKTMQAILAARLLWRQRRIEHILVICPKSLIGNWKREFEKWWPDVLAHLREAPSDKRSFLQYNSITVLVKLINYEALARDCDWLQRTSIKHDLVILDEAQRIKNADSKTAIAVKCLRGQYSWALTGTPLENRAEDLVSIMDFVNPSALPQRDVLNIQLAIRPYLLRRRLDDPNIGMQLPERIDQDIEVDLTEPQRREYERVERDGVQRLNAAGDTVTVQHVFALIVKLFQLCNFDSVTGESGKFERLIDDFEEVAGSNKKALIFSRFVSEEYGLQRVASQLRSLSHSVLELHGQIPMGAREQIVARFNGSPAERALLINYSVGGVGLNLQAAGYVFLFDRWWNPAVEDQAIKRAHRYGQKDRVIVRRYFCKDTIEERIISALKKKRRLFQEIIDEDRPNQAMGMSEEEVFSLFDLKVRPRRTASSDGPPQRSFGSLDPTDFEKLVADLYRAQGFHVDHRGGRGDGGIDVLAERTSASGLERIAIQCKHMTSPIGPEILRAHWGVVSNDQSITGGHLVTSSVFSRDAQSFANGKRLLLINGQRLKELLREHKVAEIVE